MLTTEPISQPIDDGAGLDGFGDDFWTLGPARATEEPGTVVQLSPGARVNTPTVLFAAHSLLALLAVVAALLGIVAAALPARRAGRLDVLGAIAEE